MTDSTAVIESFFAAIQAGDADAVAALYHDDLAVWHSNDGKTQNKTENLRTLKAMMRVAVPRYEIAERFALGDRVAQRHTLHLAAREGAKSAACDAAIFFTVRDGKIARIDEYIDSAAVDAITALFR
ncbi:MAG: nuclear transport factor 2 family protein [Hyphomonadaceae bacterium]